MNTKRRPRILFVGEAVTLAHVVRPLTLARSLDPDQYEIHVAWDRRYDALVGPLPFRRWTLESISPKTFAANIAAGRPIYDQGTLSAYLAADLALLEKVEPDLIVGDMRLTLQVSARLRKIPYLGIMNVHWAPEADLPLPAPIHPVTKVLGERMARGLLGLMKPMITRRHIAPMNKLRVANGLAPLPVDGFHHYSDADEVLYADIPDMLPTRPLPENHHFLGPVVWSPDGALPDFWNTLPTDRPIVYVNLGSSGAGATLPRIVEGLSRLPVTVVVATAGAKLETSAPNVFVTEYLSGEAACARASLVVCNGGSGTVQQAFLAGVPVLGVTGHFDQQFNMVAPVQSGAALELRADRVTADRVEKAAAALLNNEDVRTAASDLQHRFQQNNAADAFPRLLEEVLERHGMGAQLEQRAVG